MARLLTVPFDTTLDAARVQLASLRRMTASQRLRTSLQMSTTVRSLVEAGVRARFPDSTGTAIRQEVTRRLHGRCDWPAFPRELSEDADMDQTVFLFDILERLTRADVPYMLAGSHGASAHGYARATNDVDFVIAPDRAQLERFLESFDERYYVSREAAFEAEARKSMFNVIDTVSGWKADLIICKSRPFSLEEFNRRQTIELGGQDVFVASAEDIILSKLEWAKRGESERQLRDAEGVARLQGSALDRAYLRRWAAELGVRESLESLLERVDEMEQNS